ncbi:MAG: GGDEF domain-containing protein [Pseudomonadota bacterium]
MRKLTLEELPVALIAGSGILGIAPMTVYRLLERNYLAAVIDIMALFGFIAVIALIYFKQALRTAGICMAVLSVVTLIAIVQLRGNEHVFWIYPTTVGLFYLLKPKEAAIGSIFAVGLVVPVIVMQRPPGESAAILTSLAVTIALSVAFAALTSEQRRRLEASVRLDPLTGIGNRRALDESLDDAISALDDEQPQAFPDLAVIMLDIDHFKMVNDTHGHSMGDVVLCNVASVIEANVRPGDQCFRVGGEEFMLLVRELDRSAAVDFAERLRRAIEQTDHVDGNSAHPIRVTASFGVAVHVSGESRDSLYKRADHALYEAKDAGRNTVRIAANNEQVAAA